MQIQRVFQHLVASSERFYDPSHFCTTFKGWDVRIHSLSHTRALHAILLRANRMRYGLLCWSLSFARVE